MIGQQITYKYWDRASNKEIEKKGIIKDKIRISGDSNFPNYDNYVVREMDTDNCHIIDPSLINKFVNITI